jgi:E3 ubiquitin-protein ligase SIAH1
MSSPVSKPAVRQSVFQTLTCPLCREYMRPPITLCQAGHNICSRCRSDRSDGNKCLSCESPLLNTRNVALETIARNLVYPCRYSVAGCRKRFGMDDVAKHHAQCPHRSYDCPLLALEGCKWTGRYRISLSRARARAGVMFPLPDTNPLTHQQ